MVDDDKMNHSGQKCNNCNQPDDIPEKNPEVPVTIIGRGTPIHFIYDGKMNLMEAMLKQGIYFSASCGGRGTCGKCKVQLIEGNLEVTSFDHVKLQEQELQQGYRLSCKAYPKEACTIRVTLGDEEDFEVVADFGQRFAKDTLQSEGRSRKSNRTDRNSPLGDGVNYASEDEDYAIAIDIGTTTIAVALVGLTTKKIYDTYTTINKQRAYGADVVSRIKASTEGKREVLQQSIRTDLLEGIRNILEERKIVKERIRRIVIAGNTTMGHLLLGYSCETLGSYPFTPVNISTIELPFYEVLGAEDFNLPVIIMPGISTYVGGDIAAGLLSCNFDQAEKPCLIIDLGTNGEMAIGNKDRILVASTAAGPAFEGGNISCGVGSIAGAICSININGKKSELDTIGHKTPIGICGTGVIELTSELVKAGLVDETGLFCEEFFEEGYQVVADTHGKPIIFTQKDIREIQMAKSAIRAGVEILIRRYGATYDDIGTVYLAGGFGYKMNLEKAIHIGLLPKELTDKITAVGNSSLGGAIQYLTEPEAPERIDKIIKVSGEVHLSNDEDFNELYIEYINF